MTASSAAGARLAMKWLLGPTASDQEIDALTHLMMGAVMEAALVCATADDPRRTAQDLSVRAGTNVGGTADR